MVVFDLWVFLIVDEHVEDKTNDTILFISTVNYSRVPDLFLWMHFNFMGGEMKNVGKIHFINFHVVFQPTHLIVSRGTRKTDKKKRKFSQNVLLTLYEFAIFHGRRWASMKISNPLPHEQRWRRVKNVMKWR